MDQGLDQNELGAVLTPVRFHHTVDEVAQLAREGKLEATLKAHLGSFGKRAGA